MTMSRNEIIILVGMLCVSAAIWLMSDLAGALPGTTRRRLVWIMKMR